MDSHPKEEAWPENPSVSVVMPAFDEAESIAELVARVRAVGAEFEIIVVDDGSADETAARAREAGARVIRNPYNLGNGASIKKGAKAAGGDVVVFLDGDGQHPPEAIPELLANLGDYDMAVAARTKNSKTSLFRKFGNWMLIRVAQWIAGRKIDDLTSGFRAIKREVLLKFVHLFPSRFSYPTTITLALMRAGYFVHYVPVDEIGRRKQGRSSIRPLSDFVLFIAIIVRIILLFSPQRVFVPLGGVLLLLGVAMSAFQLWHTGGIQAAGLILLLSSVFIACFGALADQLATMRRERHE